MRRWFAVIIAVGLLIVGCSSGDEEDVLPPISADEESSATTESAGVESASEAEPDSTIEVNSGQEPDPAELRETWSAMLVAAGLPADERLPAITALGLPDGLATAVADLVDEGQESEVWSHPTLTIGDGGTDIRDCVIFAPPINGISTIYIEGRAEPDGEGSWAFTDYEPISNNCIPGEIEDAIIADYDDGNAAALEFNDPPNPDHPRIAETLTGEILESTRQVQAQLRESEQRIVIDQESHPEVIALYRDDVAIVRDCQIFGPDGGLFHNDGNRVEGVLLTAEDGDRIAIKLRMKRENGKWKQAEVEGAVDTGTNCQLPPTPLRMERVD